jgi:hypothetical protein
MDQLLRDHGHSVIILLILVIASTLGALYKLGWIRPRDKDWDGKTERRECASHPVMTQKVCSLHKTLDDVETKLDIVAERVQYILGLIEARWGRIKD